MIKQNTGFKIKAPISSLICLLMMVSYQTALAQQERRMVRIAEIEIDSAYLEEYQVILKEEAAASVRLEPGVITIFPMYEKENPAQIRILEIYTSRAAYEQHLKTPHFQKYKTTTLNMVKSLKLVDMEAVDTATMPPMFEKLKRPDAIPTLTAQQQAIVTISAFTAKGDLQQLQKALNSGLDAGLTINETKEVLVHLYAYCGFPRSIRGLQTLMTVVEDRQAKGIHDEVGREATLRKKGEDKYEKGKQVLEELTGQSQDGPTGVPAKKGYAAFSPIIEVFLKEHLFADIFGRDLLSYQDREITTIAALVSMGGVEPMARGHMGIALNIGITKAQLEQLLSLIEDNIGQAEAKAGRQVLSQVVSSDNTDETTDTTLFPKGTKITNDNFTGAAWLTSLVTADSTNDNAVGSVTFAPGARTDWHLHPDGQIIIATGGVGYYQEKGSPKQIIRKGDVVKCPPNTPHWHGAGPDQEFVQIAITGRENGPTEWLEAVTEEAYLR
jgi:quercetin dioxygenase-like cupin family protein/alkylhydroperoxidase/carboxymuconolactone decarboxylase family protein YurZ